MTSTTGQAAALAEQFAARDLDGMKVLIRSAARTATFRRSCAWHPLGFFRGELGIGADGFRYVLHCWPRGTRKTQTPQWRTHCHVWPLDSMVIEGALLDAQFARVPFDGTNGGRIYTTSNVGETSYLSRGDECVGLALIATTRWASGDRYSIAERTFHRTTVAQDHQCLTIARIGQRGPGGSEVIGTTDGPAQLSYVQLPVEHDPLVAALRAQHDDPEPPTL